MCKRISKFFQDCDYFGIEYKFLYKGEEEYKTVLGGIFFLIFCIITGWFIFTSFFSFIHREIFSVNNFSMQMSETDTISFQNYSSNVAFGLICKNQINSENASKYFHIEVSKSIKHRTEEETWTDYENITIKNCEKSDFPSISNSEFISNNLDQYFCMNKSHDILVTGSYEKNLFIYYQIAAIGNEEQGEEILTFLHDNDCQLSLYYVYTNIHIFDYYNPIEYLLAEKYITLKSTDLIKYDLYFKTQMFDSYENYFFDSKNKEKSDFYITFSKDYQTSSIIGEDRMETKVKGYKNFGHIYLRADKSRSIIQRMYAKITEFIADVCSICFDCFIILEFILLQRGKFLSQKELAQNLFQLNENQSAEGVDFQISLEKNRCFERRILTLNDKSEFGLFSKNDSEIANDLIAKNVQKVNALKKIETKEIHNLGSKSKMKSEEIISYKNNLKKNNYLSSSKLNSVKGAIDILEKNVNKEKSLNFNSIQYLLSILCLSCYPKKLKKDIKLYKFIQEKLFYQLDVFTYIERSLKLEILLYILLSKEENELINFISKPSFSSESKVNIFDILKMNDINNITIFDKNKFYNNAIFLKQKDNKEEYQKKLLQLCNIEFKYAFNKELNAI